MIYNAAAHKKVVIPINKMPDGEPLTLEMAKALPLYCYLDTPVKQLLMRQGVSISEKNRLEIVDVRYMGDAGGITCVIARPDGEGILSVSVTQVRFPGEGAVYDRINEYRDARIRWLQQEELNDKKLGRGGRINFVEADKNGRMRYSGDDGLEIITFPKGSGMAASTSKIPRNSQCPCGSGKKYKKCCGRASIS